jgi:cell division septation protein DedD
MNSQDIKETVNSSSIAVEDSYLIVIGSFGVKANATRLMKNSIKEGRDAKMKYINGLHRVIVASSENEVEAEQIKEYFAQEYGVSAFILER